MKNYTEELGARTVNTTPVALFYIPKKEICGPSQWTVRNAGATVLFLRVGVDHGTLIMDTTTRYGIRLEAGEAFSEQDVPSGDILCMSDAAGGIIEGYLSYQKKVV